MSKTYILSTPIAACQSSHSTMSQWWSLTVRHSATLPCSYAGANHGLAKHLDSNQLTPHQTLTEAGL